MKRILAATVLAAASLTAVPSFAVTQADVIGEPGVAGVDTPTIHVGPQTHYINVKDSDTVNLEINGKITTWTFDGLKEVLNLQEIIPDAPSVMVYVAPHDRRWGV
jgi:hypothetical protein